MNWYEEWLINGAKLKQFKNKTDFPSEGEEFVEYNDLSAQVKYLWDNEKKSYLIIVDDKDFRKHQELKSNLKELFLSGSIKIVNEVKITNGWEITKNLITSVFIDDEKVHESEVEIDIK